MSRLFDVTSLLQSDLAENATKRDPLPIGEVVAQVTKLDVKSDKVKKGDRIGEDWHRLDVSLEITDREYLAQYGDGTQEKAVTTLGIMLDMTPDGQIATGANRNVRLGRFRDACGANGKPLSALMGQFVRLQIGHKPNPNDPEGGPLDEITGYTKV